MYHRKMVEVLRNRLAEPRRFIQVLAGPRQTGKTTIARQLMDMLDIPHHYGSADAPTLQDAVWISQQWEAARLLAGAGENASRSAILILDEIQKVPGWPEAVKRLWDEDTATARQVYVVLLGSSPWLIQRGLTESLAGRFVNKERIVAKTAAAAVVVDDLPPAATLLPEANLALGVGDYRAADELCSAPLVGNSFQFSQQLLVVLAVGRVCACVSR